MKLRSFIVLTAVLIATTRCREETVQPVGGTSKTPVPAPVEVVRVGYIPVTHCIPLYLADMQNRFKKAGLDVRMIPQPGGPKILEALAAKSIDVGFSNVVSLLIAREQGFPFVPITGGPLESAEHKDHAVLVKTDSMIQSARDLNGKRLALNSRRNIDHLMLILWLQKYGLKETDVTLREIPFPQMEAALVNGDVDAVATAEPFITVALSHGAARVLSWNYVDVRERTFVATYVVTEDYLRAKPKAVAAFASAIEEASRVANQDPTQARAALGKYTKIDPAVIARVSMPHFEEKLDKANLSETARLSRAAGLLKTDVNIDALTAGLQ